MNWKADMTKAISNTSPLLYLYRVGIIDWFPNLFDEIWIPTAVLEELDEGERRGHNVPRPGDFAWLSVVDPKAMPSEWLSLDLGPGELSAMALALENPAHVILLDDLLARRTAQAAGLTVWGTLKFLLEGKAKGLTDEIKPFVDRLEGAGMWLSDDVRQRILALAGEN
jgi:predicted nucleic acid-binding protein